ncbi:cytochrome P450 [Nonomuraea sp. NPDC059194]|uniref:cytochrome P450 n=1 Tax=Nonomuraea sp. NPDC059194 TaxID=3346764 RepID=UPI0036B42D3D
MPTITQGDLFTATLEVLDHPPLGVPALDTGPREAVVRLAGQRSLVRILDGAEGHDLDLALPGGYRHRHGKLRLTAHRLTADVFAIKAGERRIALLRLRDRAVGLPDFDPEGNHHPALRPTRALRVRRGRTLGRTSLWETLRLGAEVALPILAQGVVLRRPLGVRLAAMARADQRANRLLARLRERHDGGPLLVRIPLRGWAVIPLTGADVRRTLHGADFTPANREKQGALGHFQLDGVLVTRDPELRAQRRAFNEEVLRADRIAGEVRAKVAEEIATLPERGTITWPDFHAAHRRIARRVVLGDAARDDERLTELLDRLRGDANWSYLAARRTDVRVDFQRRLEAHLSRAEEGSLAHVLAQTRADPAVHPEGQVPHWLFAYDAAGIAAWRALALLAARGGPYEPDRLRAALLESLRRWPTTLAILRDTTAPTTWRGVTVPAGSIVAIVTSFTDGVPFSDGPARCPGEGLVMLTATRVLGEILRDREVRMVGKAPLLDHFRLSFAVRPRGR